MHVNITSGERHGPCPYNAAGLTARMISRMCPRSSEHEYEHSSSEQEQQQEQRHGPALRSAQRGLSGVGCDAEGGGGDHGTHLVRGER